MADPMEQLIADGLNSGSHAYVVDGKGETLGLDFFLPGEGVYIEVKRMHSDRIAEQMSRAENVIAAQGPEAVLFLARLLAKQS